MGTGILALIKGHLTATGNSDPDHTVYIKVITAIGGREDVPAVIECMRYNSAPDAVLTDQRHASVAACEECLEKITGETPPAGDAAKRLQFWNERWAANFKTIVAGR